jgi:hypothetical protein
MRAYEAQLKRLRFSIEDRFLTLSQRHDIGATYVRVNADEERIYIVGRHVEGAGATFLVLNPAVAFETANAILEQGTKMGWYQVTSVDGVSVPKKRQ